MKKCPQCKYKLYAEAIEEGDLYLFCENSECDYLEQVTEKASEYIMERFNELQIEYQNQNI